MSQSTSSLWFFISALLVFLPVLYLLLKSFSLLRRKQKLVEISVIRRVHPANLKHNFWSAAEAVEIGMFYLHVKNVSKNTLKGVRMAIVHNTDVGPTPPQYLKFANSGSLADSVDVLVGNIGSFGLVYDPPTIDPKGKRLPIDFHYCGICTAKNASLRRLKNYSDDFVRIEVHCTSESVEGILAKEYVKITSDGLTVNAEHLNTWTN